MLLDEANDLVRISRVSGIACLRQYLGKSLGSGACKACLVAGVALEERGVIVEAGLPARVLAPECWHHHPLPFDELLGIQGQGLAAPEAVRFDPKEVVSILSQSRLPPGGLKGGLCDRDAGGNTRGFG